MSLVDRLAPLRLCDEPFPLNHDGMLDTRGSQASNQQTRQKRQLLENDEESGAKRSKMLGLGELEAHWKSDRLRTSEGQGLYGRDADAADASCAGWIRCLTWQPCPIGVLEEGRLPDLAARRLAEPGASAAESFASSGANAANCAAAQETRRSSAAHDSRKSSSLSSGERIAKSVLIL